MTDNPVLIAIDTGNQKDPVETPQEKQIEFVQEYTLENHDMPSQNPLCDKSVQFAIVLLIIAVAGLIGIGIWGASK